MRLRKLELKDAQYMLEWMHDKNCRQLEKTLGEVESFIRTSWEQTNDDLHLAIVSDEDVYMGTVSLKHISEDSAEFAITVRSVSMGHGYSWFGMKEMLKKAFEEIKLESVYWCVSRLNVRAVRFYDKHNFNEVLDVPDSVLER